MQNEHSTRLWAKVHSTGLGPVCLSLSGKLSKRDGLIIKNSLFVWLSLAAELADATLSASSARAFKGRLLSFPPVVMQRELGLASFLSSLDGLNDEFTRHLTLGRFKASDVLNGLRHVSSSKGYHDTWRLLAPLIEAILAQEAEYAARNLRQLFMLMSKIEVNRDDLRENHVSEFYASELVVSEHSAYCKYDEHYIHLTSSMRSILRPILDNFRMDYQNLRNGPGAVSIPGVKTQVEKFSAFGLDLRIDYLCKKDGFAGMGDFSPFPLGPQDRTSRLIFVPKTWKKLRGISAEPPGLQYFQQAIYRSLDRTMNSTYLRGLINLHDQSISGAMALQGSRDKSLATIDLSAASDSVSLQLVRDVFKGSRLLTWLLATRSTSTNVDGNIFNIMKFAPMGSACCFPIECLIFAAATLAAVAGPHGNRIDTGSYQVFGDDIICPAQHADSVIAALTTLGFCVNSQKSFVSGHFKESCGVDAWCGVDITPLKLRDFGHDFNGSTPTSYSDHSNVVSVLNSLFHRGFRGCRSFLLEKFLRNPINLKGGVFNVAEATYFGGTGDYALHTEVSNPNFHLSPKPVPGLQRSGHSMVTWKPRRFAFSAAENSVADEVKYFQWLLRFSGTSENAVRYDLAFFLSVDSESNNQVDGKPQMVPTLSIVDTKLREELNLSSTLRDGLSLSPPVPVNALNRSVHSPIHAVPVSFDPHVRPSGILP